MIPYILQKTGISDEGNIIICVREKTTTNAKAWYSVNVETETAEKWE